MGLSENKKDDALAKCEMNAEDETFQFQLSKARLLLYMWNAYWPSGCLEGMALCSCTMRRRFLYGFDLIPSVYSTCSFYWPLT